MALSGSTRMQATTIEMLIIGAALEEALLNAAKDCMQREQDGQHGKCRISYQVRCIGSSFTAVWSSLLRCSTH